MRESPLKTAILGLDEAGRLLVEAAQGLDCFTIVAVADSDANLAQQVAGSLNCAVYDDYRQLITANQLDCLFMAAPIHACAEHLKMAIKKKFNILKLPPLARSFGEATEFVKLAQDEKVGFTVLNTGRFAKSALAMRNFISQNQLEQVFFILACADRQSVSAEPQAKWRNDPVLAGGGTILYDCWETIDQIVWNFGIPQQVYCVAGNTSPDRQQRLYLTEDTATVNMKFSDTLSGVLLAGQAARAFDNKPQKWLAAQGQNMLAKADSKSFEVTNSQGQRLQRNKFDDDNLSRIKKSLENYGSNLLAPEKNPLVSTPADNLNNMAVIEAVYLSARTCTPEEPARILKIT